jgi:hypothetical protein
MGTYAQNKSYAKCLNGKQLRAAQSTRLCLICFLAGFSTSSLKKTYIALFSLSRFQPKIHFKSGPSIKLREASRGVVPCDKSILENESSHHFASLVRSLAFLVSDRGSIRKRTHTHVNTKPERAATIA